ncbi:MAG TPA: peptidylprolyl isomerase, partial [Ilumatobacteraceae bacterium]|nr:peptidylprolyl isomerase [Ilumatobacteraceae bacterium]
MQRTPLLALILAAALPLAACNDDSKPTSADAADTTVGATVCAEADGSSPRQDTFPNGGPPMCLQDGHTYQAVIETNYGTLHVDLRADIAPITVNSFVNLARFHYFDETTCHRAIQGFVVQCGDPTATGRGGPGYEFDDELDQIEPYQIGSLAMANAGPNTNGSQWFIITGDDGAMLDPNYTLFGQVIDDDLNLVFALDAVANPVDGPPLQPIDIISVKIEE